MLRPYFRHCMMGRFAEKILQAASPVSSLDVWKFGAETSANIVPVRTEVGASLPHKGRKPGKQLIRDEELLSRALPMFGEMNPERTRFLRENGAGTTGFSYHGEKIVTLGVELK